MTGGMKVVRLVGLAAMLQYGLGQSSAQLIYNFAPIRVIPSTWGVSKPYGLAVDATGALYVADNAQNTISRLTRTGTNWTATIIAGQPGINGDTDGTNNGALFDEPWGITVDGSGSLYVTQQGASLSGGCIRRITQIGTNWVTTTVVSRFALPAYIAADKTGHLYVYGGLTLSELTLSETNWIRTAIPLPPGTAVEGLGTDSSGNLYVSAQDGIREMSRITTNWVTSIVSGDRGYGIVVGNNGNLYVGINSTLGVIVELSPSGTNWIENIIATYVGGGGYPEAVTTDPSGNLYVASGSWIYEASPQAAVPPAFQTIVRVNLDGLGPGVRFEWSTIPGGTYQLQRNGGLDSTNWINIYAPMKAGADTLSDLEPTSGALQQYFRVVIVPPQP